MAGHYSKSIRAGQLLFTSGVLPIIDPISKTLPETTREQVQLVLNKIEDILQENNLNREHIIKTTCYISDGSDWSIVNEVYAEFFGAHKPARSIIPVNELHYGCKVEIEAIASFV